MSERVKELDSLPHKFMFEDRHDIEESERQAAEAEEEKLKIQQTELKQKKELIEVRAEGYQYGRKDGFEEGYRQGWREARQVTLDAAREHSDSLAAQALHAIAERISLATKVSTTGVKSTQQAAIQLAVDVAKKIADKALSDMPEANILALVTEILGQIDVEKRLLLKVHPSIIESLKPRLDIVTADLAFNGTIEIRGDSSLAPHDGRLTWQEGGAQRITEHLRTQIDDIITRHYQTDTSSEDMADVAGIMAPEGGDSAPTSPAPELIFTGEPAIAQKPIKVDDVAVVPLPEDLAALDTSELEVQVEETADTDKSFEASEAAISEAEAKQEPNSKITSSPQEKIGFMKTGVFQIEEFSEQNTSSKQSRFTNIEMNEFERLDES